MVKPLVIIGMSLLGAMCTFSQVSADEPETYTRQDSIATNVTSVSANDTQLSNVQAASINLNNYYTTNPGKIVMLVDAHTYTDNELKNPLKKVTKGSVINVYGVEIAPSGYPRLKVDGGYLTANKNNVIKVTDKIENCYTVNPGQVALLINDYVYSDVDFTSRVRSISKGSLVTVQGIEYTSTGYPRLKVDGGYLTANKSLVTKPTDKIANYYTTNPGQVALLVNDYVYSDLDFTTKVRAVSKGTLISVQGIEYTSDGYPRLKVSGGYLTANNSRVTKPVSTLSNYYVTNPGKIIMLVNAHIYGDVNLQNQGNAVTKGTVVNVQGIEFAPNGYPRLKVSGGYLTANKANVAQYKETANSVKIQQVIKLAKTKLGDPYTQSQAGRLGPNSFDCSGFVYYLYKTAAGVTLNGTVTTTEEKSGHEVSLNALKPGDLLFYGTRGSTYHVGLYEGNGVMIHASTPEDGVKETQIQYYMPSFARRILD